MVYIPGPTQTPLDPDPVVPLTAMLKMNRSLTHMFIEMDPTDIVLIPREKVETGSGGQSLVDLPPRPSQRFKFIFPYGQSDGVQQAQDAQEKKYQYVLVGEWNATIHTDDYWQDSDGQFWVVTGLSPYNGYEVKALVTSFGGMAKHG